MPINAEFRPKGTRHKGDGWIAASPKLVPRGERRALTGTWVRVECDQRHVDRILGFDPKLRDGTDGKPAEIWIDWGGWFTLIGANESAGDGDKPHRGADGRAWNDPRRLSISKAPGWSPSRLWNHPDPATQIPLRLGAISFVLGILAVVLAVALPLILH